MRDLQLQNKSVLITGADSGIGKAVALLFAQEGADIAFIYYDDDETAQETKNEILTLGRKCIMFSGDINDYEFCKKCVEKTVSEFGGIDILVNNAGVQFPSDNIENLEEENIRKTFNSNIIGMILLTKVAFPYLKEGAGIINTTSAVAYQGHEELLDYSATKGAIVSFTRSLALQSKPKGIRVNAVAPGPVATPLTKETFGEEEEDPNKPPFERNATPEEVAASFLFLATDAAAQITGQVLHPNGGIIVNG
ncbi:NAD(P)-dependent dehydrogenase, short-chain alcohol dehydrogenase family [Chryseobacterium soldanellicola]|uniref:NAD(P)-dependent dehydrogenase, short-chain alcohol dehydrogenase family n=1 Tax=Chryseobacterium soldanellicola TaxID=311333 RepID=A0A1H1GD88_9FLAO|nr:SDR family oxidoreductase [Chryseobacterium soldanellicola]SDR11085.1 NAD(P)-dependent dehydrogenase, short-chain alcohol dehydrogenase family [Chryseobacterium soldanellicola]